MIVLTHSDIMNYLRCRRMFNYSVVRDHTAPEVMTGPLALGTRVHAAIEQFHRTGQDPVDAHADLAEAARVEIRRKGDPPTWLSDQLEDDLLVGTNCTMAYRRWVDDTDPYKGWTVAGIEEMVEMPLLGGRVLLRGKIDLALVDGDGYWMIEDEKTLSPTRVDAALNHVLRSFQHGVYDIALETQRKVTVIKARYIHMKKVKDLSRTKEPVIVSDVPVVRRTSALTLQYVERIAQEILDLMDLGDEMGWYPNPQDSCSWCTYRTPCLLAQDGRGAEEHLLRDKFHHGQRLARYGPNGGY